MKKSKITIIGFLFLLAIFLLVWGINYLQGNDIFHKQRNFYAIYDKVDGLVAANPVNINGMKVGQVTSLGFTHDGSSNIIVSFIISNEEIAIPRNSIARIYSADLMGSRAIELKLGNDTSLCQPGDTLASSIEGSLKDEVNKQVQPIKRKAEELLSSIDSVVTVLQMVFNENMRNNISKSLESIKLTINNLETASYSIDTLIDSQGSRLANIFGNLESITANLENNNAEIQNIISNFSALSDTLAQAEISTTLQNTNRALTNVSNILDKVERGEGSLGQLINNDTLYYQLERSSRELEALLLDIKLNPGRYVHFSVFGKSAKRNKYVAPEDQEEE